MKRATAKTRARKRKVRRQLITPFKLAALAELPLKPRDYAKRVELADVEALRDKMLFAVGAILDVFKPGKTYRAVLLDLFSKAQNLNIELPIARSRGEMRKLMQRAERAHEKQQRKQRKALAELSNIVPYPTLASGTHAPTQIV